MQKGSLALAITLVLVLVTPTGSMADDSIVEVKRGTIGNQVADYSPTVKGLEISLISLSRSYMDYKESMESYEEVYDLLGTYETLDNLYESLSSDYSTYMGLMTSGDSDNIIAAGLMIDGDVTDPLAANPEDPDANGLTNEEELALAVEVSTMSVASYSTYLALVSTFSALGISDPNLSKREEYDTFIYPIKVAPLAIQNGAMLMGVAVEQARAGIRNGAESLFDATVMLEGYLSLQAQSYEMAQDSLVTASKKYELGQISEVAYKQAINDEQIAKLQYQSMVRDVENLKMNLNVMLGQDVLTPLALVAEVGELQTLEPIGNYIGRALDARAEMKNNNINQDYANSQMDYIEKYLSERTIEYIRVDNELEDLKLEESYEKNAIAAEIRQAYMAVGQQEENFRISKLEMEDAIRQQSDMALNVELGYVTESMAKGVDILVTQNTNDYYKAYRDYMAALATLELASSIGGN